MPPPTDLTAAIKSVPALNYALTVVAIVAGVAVARAWFTDWRIAIVGGLTAIILMVLVFIFAHAVATTGPDLRFPMLALVWFSLVIAFATMTLLFTSAFFAWPLDLKQWVVRESPATVTSDPFDHPLPPIDESFPDLTLSRLKPLTDEDRKSPFYKRSMLVISNQTSDTIGVGLSYKLREPDSESRYGHRIPLPCRPGGRCETEETNFGGPFHISIFGRNGKWQPTNRWYDLGVVSSRILVIKEASGVYSCDVSLQGGSK